MMLEKDKGKGDEMMLEKDRGKELRDEERYGLYFALEVIRRRDGGFTKEDKQLIAEMLNTSIRTVERVWNLGKNQIAEGKRRVDVSNQKKGHVGPFQLKRFTVTLDGYIEKIDKHVAYPSQLDLQLFHTNPDKEGLKYDLYGVVKHSGLPNFGHYMCTIRSSPTSWHLMNDSLVDSITETSALNQEAYLLFYVRHGMFPWFSSLLQEANSGVPSATKRMYPVNDHNVFAFENLVIEHQMNMKKQKGADLSTSSESSSLDQNASRVPTGMASVKRKCGLKRLDSPNVVLC
ncbi:ubiquitin carboxyl-terminal hydrolase 36-like [Lolium rigidum]|uniref:ubiquitin carboxyl-terminal hydrolase 36-like n=1 Tax=Lolium rigidum TaxID=89674 RepID=UPI001F5DB70A|nr:ubiquitin carboxyl-terminal hydrolase 36-like [Lolium rigidum]